MKTITLNVGYEELDKIVIQELQEDCRVYKNEIRSINNYVGDPPPHRVEDRKDAKKNLKATLRVLKYYMIKEEYKKFKGTL